jgi:hypothetical protein
MLIGEESENRNSTGEIAYLGNTKFHNEGKE